MERFEYISSLGEGAYGVVWLCLDRETNQKVAMKRFKEAHTDPDVLRLALREVRLLKAAQGAYVIKLIEAFRSKSGRVYIAMEYVERTLTQDLRKYHGKGLPPLLAKYLAWQLLQGVVHLRSKKMMHRDLKPANILLTANHELKLCDFGFARTLHQEEVADYTTYVVTRWYRAPEILVSDLYGPKVDVWAVGCLLCEMAGGRPLFPGKSSADQLWLTMRTLGPLPPQQAILMAGDQMYTNMVPPTADQRTSIARRFPQFPDDLLDVLHGCLELDPDKRMSCEEALAHPYFGDVPHLIETIKGSGKTPAEFWSKVEDAWLAAVAAKGNAVSSPSFLSTSLTHAQISSLMETITTPSSSKLVGLSMKTPPGAPLAFQRRKDSIMQSSTGGAHLLETQYSIMSGASINMDTGQDDRVTEGDFLSTGDWKHPAPDADMLQLARAVSEKFQVHDGRGGSQIGGRAPRSSSVTQLSTSLSSRLVHLENHTPPSSAHIRSRLAAGSQTASGRIASTDALLQAGISATLPSTAVPSAAVPGGSEGRRASTSMTNFAKLASAFSSRRGSTEDPPFKGKSEASHMTDLYAVFASVGSRPSGNTSETVSSAARATASGAMPSSVSGAGSLQPSGAKTMLSKLRSKIKTLLSSNPLTSGQDGPQSKLAHKLSRQGSMREPVPPVSDASR